MRRATWIISVVLCSFPRLSWAAPATVPDPLAVMAEFDRITNVTLWPGFEPKRIPVALYDGRQTWLFRHPHPPEEFRESPQHPGVFVSPGQHPALTANSSATLGDVETAIVLLEPTRRPLRETAALVVHECFHVFQHERYPQWTENEADLFVYPVDDAALLQRRFLETEALRRALLEREARGAACWISEALRNRENRFAGLPGAAMTYERNSELNEGLANYVQVLAAGTAKSFSLPQSEFPADAIRQRSYQVGTALALLLDRVAPGWQAQFTSGSLDQLLKSKTYFAATPCSFTDIEEASLFARARTAVSALKEKRNRMRADFLGTKGWQIEIMADPQHPLWPQNFDPLNMTVLGIGEVLHSRYLKLGNDDGTIECRGRALTQAAGNNPLVNGVRHLTITGLQRAPSISQSAGSVQVTADSVGADFRHAVVRTVGQKVTIEVGAPAGTK
jgi:hypothetical protein